MYVTMYYFYTKINILCRNNITMLNSSCGYNQSNVHDYDVVKTNGKLDIGILNAFKGAFDLGVKYTKEIIVTVTTAEMMVMVDLGLGAFERIVQKIKNMPELQPFGKYLTDLVDYKLKFLETDLKIIEYMGAEYLTRSYKNYVEAIELANKTGIPGNHEEQFNNFLKTINPGVSLSNIKHHLPINHNLTQTQTQTPPPHTKTSRGGGNDMGDDALKIADGIIDKILLLPLHLQLDELAKIVNKLRNVADTRKIMGGGGGVISKDVLRRNKKSSKHKKYKGRSRGIRKTKRMIYKSIQSFME